jgi:RNA 2',3'-cyclic 3'-phosphodiesterase
MTPTIRAFIAVELTTEIKRQLGKLQEQLKTSRADVKWVAPDNIHLTLKFLGQVPEEKLPAMHEALTELLRNHSPF